MCASLFNCPQAIKYDCTYLFNSIEATASRIQSLCSVHCTKGNEEKEKEIIERSQFAKNVIGLIPSYGDFTQIIKLNFSILY